MPAPGCSTGCRPTRARRWREPPIRATSIPTCWPRRNSCGASPRPHNTAPSAPEILMHRRRLLQLMAAAPSRWAPAASTPRRPRGTTGCWSYSCAAPTTPPACWCRPPATSITSRGPPSPSPPPAAPRRAAAGRRLGAASRAGRQPDAVLPAPRAGLPALRRHRGHQPQPFRDAEPHRAGPGVGQGRRRLRLGLSEPAGGRAGR